MVLALLKLFFSGVATLSNLASFIVFNGSALLVVILFKILQLPGAVISCILCLFKEQAKSMFVALFTFLGDGLSSAASSGTTVVGNYIGNATSNVKATSVVNAVVEMVNGPEVYNISKEIGKSAWEMVTNITSSNWVNILKAVKLIWEHAL